MKRILTMLLSLALVFSLFSVGAAAQSADITGVWYAGMYGMVMTLTMDETGDYNMEIAGDEPDNGKWQLDGEALTMDAGTEYESVFKYDGESIFADLGDGIEIYFTREPVELFEPAAARTDAKLEELSGEWICTLVSLFGMQMPPEMAQIDIQLSIAGEMVTMSIYLMGEPATEELQAVFADGALTLAQSPEHELGEFTAWVIQLLEDGTLSASSTVSDDPITFYLEAVAE